MKACRKGAKNMELFIRKFCDLTVTELYEIYQLREAVFILEQQ